MARPNKYPRELRERAVRMVAEVRPDYPSEHAAITAVAGMLGIGSPETVRTWIRRQQVDVGQRPGVTTEAQAEIKKLKRENAELRRQGSDLRCDVGYWKSMHARAAQRNTKLQAELDQSKAEIRQLKSERFGKQSEKQSATDRSNHLDDPQDQAAPRKKRGQQPNRPAPKRRDYSHLPARDELIDVPEDAKVCACCGKPLADLGNSEPVEQIEIETTVYRRVVRRKRFRRTCECTDPKRTVTAPLPPKLLPRSLYGTSLWRHLLLEKYRRQRVRPAAFGGAVPCRRELVRETGGRIPEGVQLSEEPRLSHGLRDVSPSGSSHRQRNHRSRLQDGFHTTLQGFGDVLEI